MVDKEKTRTQFITNNDKERGHSEAERQDETQEEHDSNKVPDEPKAEGLTPGATDVITGRPTNTLEFQNKRRLEDWDTSDFDLGKGQKLPKS